MVVGEFSQEAELAVIGGGPGGYACAFRAAELGVQTVLLDPRPALGGVCLHEGCVPSKTLLHIAETIRLIRQARQMGIHTDEPRLDLDQIRAWTARSISTLAKALDRHRGKLNIEHVRGMASFEDGRSVRAAGETPARIRFRRAVIAAGTTPIPHPMLPFDGSRVITTAEALFLEDFPSSLLVIGGGYQAVETAGIHSALGCRTSLVCESENLLPAADPDLARPLLRGLGSQLDAVHLGAAVREASVHENGVRVVLSARDESVQFDVERVVVCIGYRGCTEGLNLETTGVQCDDAGFIPVNEELRTSDPRILAVGDVTGPPLLADRALHQGRIAAEVVAGWGSAYDPTVVPHVVFSDPQMAWCGVTEAEAAADDRLISVQKVKWGASGRAVGMGRSDGMTKLIYDPHTQLVLGVGIVGPNAAELIGEAVLAIEMGAVLTDIAASIHPHPTMSELISDAARQAEHDAGK